MAGRLLVVGGTGFLGRELVTLARDAGHDVVAGSRDGRAVAGARGTALDLRRPAEVEAVVAALRPALVVNAAYVAGGGDLWPVTADGAVNVARAAVAVGARLVHLSTDVVFAGDRDEPYREEDVPAPVSEYGRAKLAAERGVAAAAPEALLVRTSLLYGGRHPGPQERLALRAAAGADDLRFHEDEVRCPTRVDELAAAILTLAPQAVAGPLHVVGPDAVDRLSFARALVRAAGGDDTHLRGGRTPPGRPRHVVLDAARATALLGGRLSGVPR